MANELIVNVTLGETRIARLENGVVAELYIERARDVGIVSNIYKGKVVRVLPGMQAAFVDIGQDRTAFLHVSDTLPPAEFEEDEAEADDLAEEPASGDEEEEKEQSDEEKEAPLRSGWLRRRRRGGREVQIQDLIRDGQELLVQATKEPIGTKGARLTSYISLPGRYLVYTPTMKQVGVSRRIADDRKRARLREIVQKHRPPGAGFIVRTAAERAGQRELVSDIEYLLRLGREIETKGARRKAPSLIHAELDVVLRVVRDLFTEDIDRLVIDAKPEYTRIQEFADTFMPQLKERIELYTDDEPIFDHFSIEVEINRALGQKVWLKSGGYIIVEQTEALTAIDVNTGKFVGKRNVEETILKTNLEAVREIVYQLRLRNIGGIIILDFIDMERHEHRNKVYNALKEALKHDRARTNISKISELGLVEMTRKRTREDIRRLLGVPCPYCEGKGFLKSQTTLCYEIFREITREALRSKAAQLTVMVNPTVANTLFDEERTALEQLEQQVKKRIQVQAMPDFHLEQFELIETTKA
ncbi:MAG: Rne/Rng family ribonuclease [Deltaproteobacteria bacterium]|nr:Rne/Rng family ribonuclease [Deltaproteobacteria bacterium]